MRQNSSRGRPRPIDSVMHGATDYTVGTTLMTAFPRLANIEGTPSARQIRTEVRTPARPEGGRGAYPVVRTNDSPAESPAAQRVCPRPPISNAYGPH